MGTMNFKVAQKSLLENQEILESLWAIQFEDIS